MDAAQLTRKLALVLAGSLLFAGAASAATSVDPASITLSSLGGSQKTVTVTTDANFKVVNNAGWFTVSPTEGTAAQSPVTLTVTLIGNCTTTLAGCNTSFKLTNTAGDADLATVAVSNSTNPGSGGTTTNNLTASPSSVTLSAIQGTQSQVQRVAISTTSTSSVPLQWTSSQSWLAASIEYPQTIVSGTSTYVDIQASAAGLANNTQYTGTILVAPVGSTSGVTINVTFNVGSATGVSGTLISSPSSLTFSYPSGTQQANFTVTTNTSATTQFYVSATTQYGGAWLSVNAFSTTPYGVGTTLTAAANAFVTQSLPTGTYQGTITLTNANNFSDTTTIPVLLMVNGGSGTGTTISAGPTSLAFVAKQNGDSPRCQKLSIPTSGNFTVQTTASPQVFFTTSASSQGFTGPGDMQVCPTVNVPSLPAGSYTGAIVLSNSIGYSQQVNVGLTVYSQPIVTAIADNVWGDITCSYQSGTSGCNASNVAIAMSDGSEAAITATSSVSWVTVELNRTTAPANLLVRINPASLGNGMNTATVTITASGSANGSVTVPVAVYVTGSSGSTTGNLTLGVSSMSFSPTSSQSQTLSVSATATGTAFTASLPSSNCGWLQLSPSGALATPQNITVSILTPPTTTSTCNITLTSGSSTQTVPVTYTVSGSGTGSINVDKTSLSFTTQQGKNPDSQTIKVTGINDATGVAYTVGVTTDDGGSWLTVTPMSGSTPGTLTVSINATNLSLGAHGGNVVVSSTGGNAYRIGVAVVVTAPTSVSASPASLSFSYVGGNANPATQKIEVTGSASGLTYSASVTSGSNWLSVTPVSGTAPATLTVSVDPSSLAPSSTAYTGTIVVAGSGSATGSTTINVSLTVTAPLPTVTSVTNAASSATGRLAAGELIAIFGTAMGPSTAVTPASGITQFPTTLGGVTVTIGGYPAPLLYVSNSQINAVVPYEINKPFIANPTVIVKYLGQTSNGVTLPQVGAYPGIFTVGGGAGQAAALNQNLSQNLASNPANKGEVIVLYLTGEGQTSPAGTSGAVTPSTTPFAKPVSGDVTATIDGQPANVEFFGEAPGIVSGVMQVNVRIPATVGSGAVPVVVRVGDVASQINASGVGTVTIAVK